LKGTLIGETALKSGAREGALSTTKGIERKKVTTPLFPNDLVIKEKDRSLDRQNTVLIS